MGHDLNERLTADGASALITAYRAHHLSGERAITSFRFARADVARQRAAARADWFREMGFTLAMIGLAAACDESDEAYEARTRRAA